MQWNKQQKPLKDAERQGQKKSSSGTGGIGLFDGNNEASIFPGRKQSSLNDAG